MGPIFFISGLCLFGRGNIQTKLGLTHTHTQKQMKEGAEDHGEKSTAGATTTGTRGEEK